MTRSEIELIAWAYARQHSLAVANLKSVVPVYPVGSEQDRDAEPEKWQATFVRESELTEISSKPYIFLIIENNGGEVAVFE